MYIYERKSWPVFTWDQERIASLLIQVRHQQGRLIGGMETIGLHFSEEVVLQTLTQDVVKSSEIEGEILDQALVRSSVARRLGIYRNNLKNRFLAASAFPHNFDSHSRLASRQWSLAPNQNSEEPSCQNPDSSGCFGIESAALNRSDRNVDGVVEMMLDATQKFNRLLTKQRLFNWHASLFPTARSGFTKIQVGAWRKGDVEVVSGAMGREVVHFEGPPATQVSHEMKVFLDWVNREPRIDLVLKAAIAHLWFVTIHPFDDGNGRIGRAIADLLLARSEKSSRRFYSLSAQIQAERKDYYKILEKTQKDGLDITPWLEWFLQCLTRAIDQALSTLDAVKDKERIWGAFAEISLNDRQRKLINRLLDGFDGKLTTSKWAKIAKCSQDTAYRDILDLVDRGILMKDTAEGRSTSYSLAKK